LELHPIKTAVLQPEGRKTARAGYKITNFGTGSYYYIFTMFYRNLAETAHFLLASYSKVCYAGAV
jgi:hypothetical protein